MLLIHLQTLAKSAELAVLLLHSVLQLQKLNPMVIHFPHIGLHIHKCATHHRTVLFRSSLSLLCSRQSLHAVFQLLLDVRHGRVPEENNSEFYGS